MSQTTQTADVSSGASRSSLWLAAVGFLLIALGTGILSWIPSLLALEDTVQALGTVLVAVALLMNWRRHAARWGWAAFIFIVLGILAYAVMWSAYAIDPNSIGTTEATQRSLITVGVGYLCAAIGMFLLIGRKQRQLTNAPRSGELTIAATFPQLWLFGIGAVVFAVGMFEWLIPTASKLQHIIPLTIGWALVAISAITLGKLLTRQVGRPAAVMIILAVVAYWVHFALDALPMWADADWRQPAHWMVGAYVFAALACILMATRKR